MSVSGRGNYTLAANSLPVESEFIVSGFKRLSGSYKDVRGESSPKAGEVTLVSCKAMHQRSEKTSSLQTVADGFPSATI
jgi:hypothetical protein